MNLQNEQQIIEQLQRLPNIQPRTEFVDSLEQHLITRAILRGKRNKMLGLIKITGGIASCFVMVAFLFVVMTGQITKWLPQMNHDVVEDSTIDDLSKHTIHHLQQGQVPVGLLPDGTLILTESNGKNQQSIVAMNEKGEKQQLVQGDMGSIIYDTVLSGNWVIYGESPNPMKGTDWKITAIQIGKHGVQESFIIDQSKPLPNTPMAGPTPFLSASNGKVVWSAVEQDAGTAVKVIRMFDIKQKTSEIVEKGLASELNYYNPQIDGNWLVYGMQSLKTGVTSLYLKNLQNGGEKELDKNVMSIPFISTPFISWENGMNEIALYNVNTKQTQIIADAKGNKNLIGMKDQNVAWIETSSSTVHVLNLFKGTEVKLPNAQAESGAIVGNILYWYVKGIGSIDWMDMRNGNA